MDAKTLSDSLELAEQHLNAGRVEEAETAFRRILAVHPSDVRTLLGLALTLQRQQRLDEAAPLAEKASELEPQNPLVWHRLGELGIALQAFFQAAKFWARVVELVPNNPRSIANLGWSVHQLGRFAEAEEHYRAALKIDPDFVTAHGFLARLRIDRGDMEGAEESIRTVLALEPTSTPALTHLVSVLGGKLPAADAEKIAQCIADPSLDADSRAMLIFTMARSLDSRGDFKRAAALARQGNALRMTMGRRKTSLNDPEKHDQFVESSLRCFTRDFLAKLAGAGDPSTRPIFVFGMPRSGTTLAEQVLASHSKVYGAGELPLGRDVWDLALEAIGDGKPLGEMNRIDAQMIAIAADQFLSGLNEYDGGTCPRIVDKNPTNYLTLGLLSVMFPHATFVSCRRDLRDVAVSCWMMDFRELTWADDINNLARRIQGYVRIMEHWRQVLPVKIHEVQYESMVEDIETHARALVAACGLEWEDACLNFHRTKRPVRTASFTQVRQPVYKKSVARWKHYEHELADLFSQLPPNP